MALVCKKCGYRTENESLKNCPQCDGLMESESKLLPRASVQAPVTSGIQPYIVPLLLIVLVLAALIYLLSQPKGSSLFKNMPKAPIQSMMTVLEDAGESSNTAEVETDSASSVATDPSGNEILTDYELPGLEIQPEYVLAESARTSWTVSTQNDSLNMRSGPNTGYAVVGKLSKGTRVIGWGYSSNGPSNWIVVEYNAQYGWVCTDYLTQN